MTDIVERLRGDHSDERLEIAADEIERLREALKKIVELDWQFKTSDSLQRTEGPCAAIARAALKEGE